MAERFKLRHVNEITGVFVIAVVAVLIVAVVWTGRSQRWFRSSVTLRITLPEAGAAGIRQGSEVYFLGTLVGSVSGVEVDERGRMEAQANIRRDFFLFVRADSSAVVKKKFGVAGDSFFEITRGKGAALPEKNAAIVCNEQFQSALESAIEEIRSETLLVLKKTGIGLDTWTVLGTNLDVSRQHLNEVIARLDNIAGGVEQGKGTAGKLITDPALADELQQLLAGANEAMSGLRGVVTNIEVAVENIQNGTARIPEITADVAGVTKILPGLVQQSQTSMRELERLIEAAQKQWLIRKYVNHTNPPASGRPPEATAQKKPPGKQLASPKSSGD
jgi:phospholipid/cholesterol/gamma-HCH transport system substrate-binding protein